MVIPIMMPVPVGGGGGYVGPNVDLDGWNLPPLPGGWHWEVTDNGGKPGYSVSGFLGFLVGNPCILWLYGPHGTFVDREHNLPRKPKYVALVAQEIIRRSVNRAAVDHRFAAFVTGGK